jgi:hypothetical protein
MWVVEITKPVSKIWKDSFFPRKFRYKREAEQIVKEVRVKGGEAVLYKQTKLTNEEFQLYG